MFASGLLLLAAFAGSPLVVQDAATVSVTEARKIISDIDAGRPALIVGGPLLARHKVEWNGKSAFPTVEGVWPEYKTYVKDDRVCYLDRLTGEGFGRGNVWRMKRLVNETEAILIERRKGRPERCVALFGYRKAEDLADPGVRARMNWALKAIGEGGLLFEAGTDQFSYDPGETVTVGAGWRGRPKTLSIEIVDARGTRLVRRDFKPDELGAGWVSFTWKPPIEPARYHVKTVLNREDVIEHDFAVARMTPDPREDFIAVRGADFILKGQPWYPVCINFFPNYVGGTERADYWSQWLVDGWYSPNLVRKDILNFVACGGNAVSIQNPAPGNERNVRDFYRICRECGVRVSQYVNWADPLSFNDEKRMRLDEFLKRSGAVGDSTVFAYDTVWEPGNYVFKREQREALNPEWHAWTLSQYGSVERAERYWGITCGRDAKGQLRSPPNVAFEGKANDKWRRAMASYRRFMDNYTARRWNVLKRELRLLAPNQLQSFRQGNTLPHDFALNGPVRHLDFVMPEGYSFHNTDAHENAIGWVTRYIDAYSGGKPIIWSEFGRNAWDASSRTTSPRALRECAVYSERFYRAGLLAGANGFSPWWFTGGYRTDERSDYGIMGPDDLPRPPLEILKRYSAAIKLPRKRSEPTVWMDFDRDANGGGYYEATFNAGRVAFSSAVARRATLGVRLAGVGMTSVDCPATGLGEVPLEGRMPVKYLDADFDVFSCRQVSRTLLKVRAQLGNPGPAAWKGASVGTGGVNLAVFDVESGKTIRTVPLVADVPRFGESEFLEFEVPLDLSTKKIAFMLESAGRFRFGERRELEIEE